MSIIAEENGTWVIGKLQNSRTDRRCYLLVDTTATTLVDGCELPKMMLGDPKMVFVIISLAPLVELGMNCPARCNIREN